MFSVFLGVGWDDEGNQNHEFYRGFLFSDMEFVSGVFFVCMYLSMGSRRIRNLGWARLGRLG